MSAVATLPWEIQKSLLTILLIRTSVKTSNNMAPLSTYYLLTSDYLSYLRIKPTVTVTVNLPTTFEKMSPHNLVKCITCLSDWRYIVFLQMLHGGSKKSRLCCVALTWHWHGVELNSKTKFTFAYQILHWLVKGCEHEIHHFQNLVKVVSFAPNFILIALGLSVWVSGNVKKNRLCYVARLECQASNVKASV